MASDVKLNINSINFYFTRHLWFPKPLVIIYEILGISFET